jgi:hypothetical protein
MSNPAQSRSLVLDMVTAEPELPDLSPLVTRMIQVLIVPLERSPILFQILPIGSNRTMQPGQRS